MSKLLGLAVLAGTLGACTLSFIPPASGKNEIEFLCQYEGHHQIGTDAYTACLKDEAGLALVHDIGQRNGGITPFR